jgi:hypothetical protein
MKLVKIVGQSQIPGAQVWWFPDYEIAGQTAIRYFRSRVPNVIVWTLAQLVLGSLGSWNGDSIRGLERSLNL